MRKFTKEISALLASAAVGTAACAINVSAVTSEQSYRANAPGWTGITDEEIEDYLPPEAGEAMPEDNTLPYTTMNFPNVAGGTTPPDWQIQPTTEEMLPPTAGVPMISDEDIEPTTEEMPPLAGGFVLPDPEIIPTTTMETMPPLAGTELPPDWRTTAAETKTTSVEEMPPIAGDVALPDWTTTTTTAPDEWIPHLSGQYTAIDGDINGDMELGISDVVLLQKWLLGDRSVRLDRWGAADLNNNGRLDVYDLCLLKKNLIAQRRSKIMTIADIIRLSQKGMDLTLADLDPYKCEDVGSGLIVDEYEIADDNSIVLVVGHDGTSDKPMYARLKSYALKDMIDIRSDEFQQVGHTFMS